MPRRVDFASQRDFTGGLNLARDAFVLPPEATPDCLNVDLDGRGGFYLRRGVAPWINEALPASIVSLMQYTTTTGTAQLLVGTSGNTVYRWDGADWDDIFTGIAGPYRSATYKDRCYIVSDGNATRRWDGSTVQTMMDPDPSEYNDNIAAPTVPPLNGKFPKAACITTYQNVVMVGNVTEGSTNYPCRVRWSHPGFPEDWFSYHYIDIEPEDGDEITALVPMQDRLIVFKHNSVHAIYGSPPEDFGVTPIARDVGAASQEAVVTTDVGVFFWHESTGLHHLSSDPTKGTSTRWVWEPLWPAIEDGRVSVDHTDKVQVGWLNRRVWVSVPWELSTTRNRTFVFDPFIGKKQSGAWTVYDLPLGPFLAFSPPGDLATPLAANTDTDFVLEVEQFDQFYDNNGELYDPPTTYSNDYLLLEDGDVLLMENEDTFQIESDPEPTLERPIVSYYLTPWQDAGEPIIKKRWKRPEVVVLLDTDSRVVVQAYRNYNSTFAYKHFIITTSAQGGGAQWDDATWDVSEWAKEEGDHLGIKRGSPLGNANSVALKFQGPTDKRFWRLDALSFKWIAKRLRN